MDLTRWVGWLIFSVNSKRKKTRQQLFPLHGDKKKGKPSKLTKDKFLSLVEGVERRRKKK